MFLCCGKYEYSMCRRFLKGLQEGIESRLGEHVHLVDDIYAVSSDLRRDTHLVHEGLDVFDSVVGCRIQLMYAVRPAFCKGKTRLTCSARLHFRRRAGAVYHLREYTRCGRLSDSSRSAKEVCMSKLPPQNRILQGLRYIVLADECPEGIRPVLSC